MAEQRRRSFEEIGESGARLDPAGVTCMAMKYGSDQMSQFGDGGAAAINYMGGGNYNSSQYGGGVNQSYGQFGGGNSNRGHGGN